MRADILLLIHTPGWRLGVPAKLYEYLGAGRPILALAEPDSDIAWVLRTSKVLHRIAPPRDVPAIRQALLELAAEVQAGSPAAPIRTRCSSSRASAWPAASPNASISACRFASRPPSATVPA